MKEYFSNLSVKRVLALFFGVFFIGAGAFLLKVSRFGNDPFTCMNLGVVDKIGVSLGTYQLLVNLGLFVFMLAFYRHAIGIGTIVNMALVGYIVDFLQSVFDKMPGVSELLSLMPARAVTLVVAVVVMTFGIALYLESDLGMAPYDALAPILEIFTKGLISFSAGRIITDIICVFIGFLAGGIVGLGTVTMAFFTGPVVSFFRRHMNVQDKE